MSNIKNKSRAKKVLKNAAAALAAFALFAAPSFAQPKTVDIQKNALHKEFFSVPISIIPRAGFTLKKSGAGVCDAAKKVSLESSVINMPFDEFVEELSSGRLSKEKMSIKSQSSFIWNGDRAELLKIFQPNGGVTMGKWVLIIDRGPDLCWMISGAYNSADANMGAVVLAMIKSAWWPAREAEIAAPPLLGSVETKGTPFKIAGFRQGSLVYTKDGAIPTKDADQALFVISRISSEYILNDKRSDYAKAKIADVERGAKLDIISQGSETVGGTPAVVIVAYTADKEPALIYQAALFKNSSVTLLVGIARRNTAKNLEIFNKLTASYKEN